MSSETFTQTARQLITAALRDARIIAAEQPIQARDLIDGLQAINLILKHWQAQGIHLWSEREAILPLNASQRKYLLGPDGDDIALSNTFFNTTTTTDMVATDTIIPLTATSGTTVDGQAIAVTGSPYLLVNDVTETVSGWISQGGAGFTIVPQGIEIENLAIFTGAGEYPLITIVGNSYRVDFSYIVGTSPSAIISVFDSAGTLDSQTLSSDTDSSLTFIARETTTFFRAQNTVSTQFVTSIIGFLNYLDLEAGERIGIELDSGLRHWDYVVTVDTSTQVTIKNGLPSTASSGNTVYTYSTKIARPMRLLQARFAETVTASEIPVRQWSRDDYFDQPDKDSSGTVVNWYYSPTLTNGELYVWQVANDVNQVLRFTYIDPLEIPTEADDTLEVPSEWYLPLKWAIGAELGPSRGLPDNRQVILESKAANTLAQVLGFDVERESLSFQPDYR